MANVEIMEYKQDKQEASLSALQMRHGVVERHETKYLHTQVVIIKWGKSSSQQHQFR